MYCSTCGDERLFEQPPCPDGHGPDCPERFCAECGTAVLIGLPPVVPVIAGAVTGPLPGITTTSGTPTVHGVPALIGTPASGRTTSARAVA
ncbi:MULTISPECIES: hypothetical protein [Thermomonosporaceae]|uniref:hypothetical protein n=1 Tax=Thermomonosporaceae TaxID=2012 RepID=UPI00255B26C9|nr:MULTISPECIES: hypothetical protein [Thermomonosporaceae]MDL4774808.1 hypothetical protein [Actinomadura xylanilytica]